MKPEFVLRKAVASDIDLLYHWANDKEVRNNSINSKDISFQEHQEWFNKKFSSTSSAIYILEKDSQPIGQIRFDLNENENIWEIDYSISEKYRGKGWGKVLLQTGINVFNRYPVCGYVRKENAKSQAVFYSLGFINEGLQKNRHVNLFKFIKKSA